jgi:hypothetical protein
MGQDLFYPPNVGGWSGGNDWLSGQYVVSRANFATSLVQGRLSSSGDVPDLLDLCERLGCRPTAGPFVEALGRMLLANSPDQHAGKIAKVVRESGFSAAEQLPLAASLMLSLPQAQYA